MSGPHDLGALPDALQDLRLGALSGPCPRPPRRWRALKALGARPLAQPMEWATLCGRTYPLRLGGRRWALSLAPEVWAARREEGRALTPLDAGEAARYEALRRALPGDWLKPLLSCAAVSVAEDLERAVSAGGRGPLCDLRERCDDLARRALAHALLGVDLRRDAEAELALRAARARCEEAWGSADPWAGSGAGLGRGAWAARAWRRLCGRLERLAATRPRLAALLGALRAAHEAPAPPGAPRVALVDESAASALLKCYAQLSRDVSHACQWTWAHTSRDARWREALAHEVRGALGERPYAEEALGALTALRAALAEGLRLYPPSWREAYAPPPAPARRAAADAEPHTLDGLALHAGAHLLWWPFWAHRDERAWEEPHAWRPERWLHSAEGRLSLRAPRGLFAPFGLAPPPAPSLCAREHLWTHATAALLTSALRRGAYVVEEAAEVDSAGADSAGAAHPLALRGGGLAPPAPLHGAFCVSARLNYVRSERL